MITISWSALIAICAAVITVSGAVSVVVKFITFLRKPEVKQTEDIQALKKRMDSVDSMLSNDKERLESLETGLKYILQSLQALLLHAIDGNDIDSLKKARDNLNSYLLEKVGR